MGKIAWIFVGLFPRVSSFFVAQSPRTRNSRRYLNLVEEPGRFLRDEVPDDGLQKWVAWCEMRDKRGQRIERRRELLQDHYKWQRSRMLPSMVEQYSSEFRHPEDDSDRPSEEKGSARILWEKALLRGDEWYPDAMCVCIAAASRSDFEELLFDDPFFRPASIDGVSGSGGDSLGAEDPVFDHVETFQWTQVNDADLRYNPFEGVPYIILCKDKGAPGRSAELRQKTRPAHLDFLRSSQRVNAAGPLRPPPGDHDELSAELPVVGSLVVCSAEDEESALEWASQDPYAIAGLFESTAVRRAKEVDITGLYILGDGSADSSEGNEVDLEEEEYGEQEYDDEKEEEEEVDDEIEFSQSVDDENENEETTEINDDISVE